MATTMQTFPKILKMLRENSSMKEKRKALTYISSNARKLDCLGVIKEEQYKELCKLVIEIFTNTEPDAHYEAYEALSTIIQDFKDHKLNLFEALLQTNRKNRLKILKLLEVLEDSAISSAAKDIMTMNFFNDCMHTVQSHTMEWTTSTTAEDNKDAVAEGDTQSLSDEQKLEEEMINYAVALLRRLYKVADKTTDQTIHRFDTLLMDKIVTLAYLGNKRQRGTALKLLKEAVTTSFPTRIRTNHADVWSQYKSTLQSVYCKRMLHLVGICDIDWATQWNISIQFLGTDLHYGASLINNLLSVEERAFKSTDSIIRRQAFLSWKLLVDNFALDPQELATARRIKLLCIPLNAKNSKTELIALTKLEVWWHLVIKLYKDISKFVNPVITQFLNFCFGPLGDTPLLSTKFDVIASPGKRFSKTKVVAIDALRQLLVPKQESHTDFAGVLEERLPYSISNEVFQECHKSIIHSVGEALLVLSQLTDNDMKNRAHIGKTLWISLISYIKDTKAEIKNQLYKDIVLLIVELLNHATGKPLINDLIINLILPELVKMFTDVHFKDDALADVVLKLISTETLIGMESVHCDAIKTLLWQYAKASNDVAYHPNTLNLLGQMAVKLQSVILTDKSRSVVSDVWCILAEIITKYMENGENINEGNSEEHKFSSLQSVLLVPFAQCLVDDTNQAHTIVKMWRTLYKQFESTADSLATVRPNEIVFETADMIRSSLKNNKKCCYLAVQCVDVLLSTVNYKTLSGQHGVPTIVALIADLCLYSLNGTNESATEAALKAQSTLLITTFGHDPEKVVSYLCASKPVIELMLMNSSSTLCKEITNTWETVVSIFKGLNKLFTYDLLSTFREIILQAASHANTDIQTKALSILEIRDGLQDTTKNLLEELRKKVKQDKQLLKSDNSKKIQSSEKITKSENMVGSFLNRKPDSPKPILNKQTNKDEKKVPHSLDSDTEEYVPIKTDLNFDVNRMTENQKESLKRRRDDIPAFCNDLSQSSSQDTQQLQEWFSRKNKFIDAVNKSDATKKENMETNENIDNDPNKENKLKTKELGSDRSEIPLSTLNEVNNSNDTAQTALNNLTSDTNDVTKTGDKDMSESTLKNSDITDDNSEVTKIMTESISDKTSDVAPLSKLIGRRLDFESRVEFPEENHCERPESPSVLDSSKRRNRSTTKFATEALATDEASRNEESLSKDAGTSKRTLRGKSDNNKPFIREPLVINEIKKGLKRKSASDSETDVGMHLRRRRKLSNGSEALPGDSNSIKPTESKILSREMISTLDNESLSQKSKKEIMRLQINMVFDSPLPNRRRSKLQDESNKGAEVIAERTHPSPENRGTKFKFVDVRSVEQIKDLKRVTKNLEKDSKPSAAQPISTRRKRRSLRQETDKNDDIEGGVNEKSSDTKENGSEAENAENTGSSTYDSSPDVEDSVNRDVEMLNASALENESTPPDDLGKEEESNKSDPLQRIEEKSTNEDDGEDIVENSQAFTRNPKVEKKQIDKQCVVAIDKMDSSRTNNCDEVTAVVTDVPECNMTDKATDLEDPKIDTVESDPTQVIQIDKTDTIGDTQVDISEGSCGTQQDDAKSSSVESSQKSNENSTLSKSVSIITQSPKSNPKRYSKLKAYPTGRAAHMLGLVTKQGLMENDGAIIRVDDDASSKKVKPRDTENESGKKDKLPAIKEVEKIGGPCGSRQEKIFSNMRSTDFNSSSPIKLFSNLKNDGEKMLSKVEKRISDMMATGEQGSGKENDDNLSPLHEKDDLPMLEWSSANPPSLTASPSASILKRNRAIVPEPDTDSTPNKRKRVSFADPPVSKEMGYEITNTGSPHKINKLSTPRAFLSRKDSPLRLRQNRLKFIQIDPERTGKENELHEDSTSEVDLQCERENELLSKIAEELEYTENMSMDVEPSTSCNYMDIESSVAEDSEAMLGTKVSVHRLDNELQIKESTMPRSENDAIRDMNTSINLEAEESDTQQDIFNCAEDKHLREISDNSSNRLGEDKDILSPENTSIDHIKIGVTNDSIIAPHDDSHLETLEDTVDVQNVTNLNFTANCEEMFSGKLIRTSTQAVESTAEEDTLPVTDSMVVSQDSEHIQPDTEIYQSEAPSSLRPVFASLISSTDPIACIIRQLVSPSSLEYLSTYFANKGLRTVGDLAQLSEQEVSKLPVKGQLKVELVKGVLQRFESTRSTQQQIPSGGTPVLTNNKLPLEATERLNNSVNFDDSVVNAIDNTKSVGTISGLNSVGQLDKMRTMNSVTCSKLWTDILRGKPSEANSPKTYGNGRLSQAKPTLSITTNVSNLSTDRTLSMPTCSASSVPENSGERSLKTTGTITDPVCVSTRKATKSVASQMALEDLLDEIDVNLVLESAVRRCSPQHILSEYKTKMRHMPEAELGRETLRMIGIENTASCSDMTLKSVCRACGVNKVLLRLPDIFSTDKEFFVKVFTAYRQKIRASDCLDVFDPTELKEAICQKCTSSELAQMLSKRLKEDEGQGIRTPMTELSSLNAMLKRMPMDVIISHTVANDELIPSQVVLDIALQNNTPEDIMRALESRSPMVTKYTFDKLWTPQTVTKYIQDKVNDRDALLDLYKAVTAKLSMQDLINASHESMRQKVETIKEEK